jgi:homoserine kinase type II
MGLFTELGLDEMRRLGGEFGVAVASVEPLAAGSVNSNFRVIDSAGRAYFARIFEEQGAAGAYGELCLLSELARARVPVAAPIPSGTGAVVITAQGKPLALYPWIEGDILCQARVEPWHCRAVGEALARLHLASPNVTPLASGRFRIADLFARLDRIDRESPEHRDAALHVRRRLEHYEARRNPELPSGVVHGDLFRDNVLWRADRIEALIDFESASYGPFAFDVMVTLMAWCYGDSFRSDLVSELLGGYVSCRRFESSERAALADEGALAALRFATTRITDFSMRAPPGVTPKRDYRRFLARLEAIENGMLTPFLWALGG